MNSVEVGQVWEMSREPNGRMRGRVLSIDGDRVTLEWERSWRIGVTPISTLRLGRRGSRCVFAADGSPVPKREPVRVRRVV